MFVTCILRENDSARLISWVRVLPRWYQRLGDLHVQNKQTGCQQTNKFNIGSQGYSGFKQALLKLKIRKHSLHRYSTLYPPKQPNALSLHQASRPHDLRIHTCPSFTDSHVHKSSQQTLKTGVKVNKMKRTGSVRVLQSYLRPRVSSVVSASVESWRLIANRVVRSTPRVGNELCDRHHFVLCGSLTVMKDNVALTLDFVLGMEDRIWSQTVRDIYWGTYRSDTIGWWLLEGSFDCLRCV